VNDISNASLDDQGRFRALTDVIAALQPFEQETRRRILATVLTYYGYDDKTAPRPHDRANPDAITTKTSSTTFSSDRSISPKEFLLQKRPQTDIERVAALAYYLTHYRETPRFKTFDISKLNTEAAQIKFSNAAQAVDNAAKRGFLTSAAQGTKQITAMGEQFVQALPDREAAKVAIAGLGRRRKSRKTPARDEQPQ